MTFQVIQMSPRTLSWWRDEKDNLDLDPVYQRKGHIWTDKHKQFLIDSILNGFDIPKLYMADFTFLTSELNIAKKRYAVIDGKQRLLAIFDFFEDRVTLPKGFIFSDDPDLILCGYSYSDLLKTYPKVARKFDNSSLTIMSVITDDESKINELFVRLNSSKPLTGAELRNAMVGTIPTMIRDLADHSFFKSKVKFSIARSQDKNAAAKLLLLEHRGSIIDTKKKQLDALLDEEDSPVDENCLNPHLDGVLEETLEDTETSDVTRSANRVKDVLDRMNSIFIDSDPLLRQQAQIVLIYWLVRSLKVSDLKYVRPFLLEFTEQRSSHTTGAYRDPEIARFELMARTSNDSYSIRDRYMIVLSRFQKFIESNRSKS